MTEEATPEQIVAALGYIDKTIDNCQDLPPDLAWDNSEVLEMLAQVRTELVAAAGAAPQEPTYSPHTRSWSGTCPCILSEQVDPECEWHGRWEFRPGGELHPSAPSSHMVTKAARVLHTASCCKLDEGAEHQEPQNEDLFAAGVVLNAVPLAPVQVDEAKLASLLQEHRPSQWRSFANDTIVYRCCRQDFGRLTGKPRKTDRDPRELWEEHMASKLAESLRGDGR